MFPTDADYYVYDGDYVFYREFEAFGMRLLYRWSPYSLSWYVAGHLPWADLVPINEILPN